MEILSDKFEESKAVLEDTLKKEKMSREKEDELIRLRAEQRKVR